MAEIRIEKVLKRDSFGCVELLRVGPVRSGAAWPEDSHGSGTVRLIRRVVTPRFGFGWIAALLARREARALEVLRAMEQPGVPSGDPTAALDMPEATLAAARSLPSATGLPVAPARVFLRPFAEGLPLHRAEALPLDFFDLLEGEARRLHRAGVCHNDLHKEQNIVVGLDGRPVIIDFQLATRHPKKRGRWYHARCRDDLRHVQKHRRRYTRDGRGPMELRVADDERIPRRGIALVWMKTGKPLYKFITRKLLRTRDGEEIRPSSGPWPVWAEPVGARPGGVNVDGLGVDGLSVGGLRGAEHDGAGSPPRSS